MAVSPEVTLSEFTDAISAMEAAKSVTVDEHLGGLRYCIELAMTSLTAEKPDTKAALAMLQTADQSFQAVDTEAIKKLANRARGIVAAEVVDNAEPFITALAKFDGLGLDKKSSSRGPRDPNKVVTYDLPFACEVLFKGKVVHAEGQRVNGTNWNSLRHYTQKKLSTKFSPEVSVAWKSALAALKSDDSVRENGVQAGDFVIRRMRIAEVKAA